MFRLHWEAIERWEEESEESAWPDHTEYSRVKRPVRERARATDSERQE